jgi:hypothetical protein
MCILKKTDFAYPAKMRDFFQGLEIDRSNLRLIEDAAKTPVDIDDETVSAIAQTAARVLESL